MTKPIGVYIHIPFCRKRCSYCDFFSGMPHPEMTGKYISRLKSEIYRWGEKIGRPADTIYFGGGTPSVLKGEELCDILEAVKDSFNFKNGEITLEVNPESATREFLETVKKGGFNRLSIGIQSLNDKTLSLLKRTHNKDEAKLAFNNARKVGFDNISVDLMMGLPGESRDSFLDTVNGILRLSPEHISCYILTLEERTLLYKNRDKLSFPDEEEISDIYLELCSLFEKRGYNHYEISNFSKKGYVSKHNTKYWKDEEYIGIGPSAYSFIGSNRFHYVESIHSFLRGEEIVSDGIGGEKEEYIMLSLRLKEGLKKRDLEEKYKESFSKKFIEKAKLLSEDGLAFFDGERFYLTDKGMLLSNSIICGMTEEEMYENL